MSVLLGATLASACTFGTGIAYATDHGDTAIYNGEARNDARLTDFFTTNRGDKLVVVIDTNPTIGTASQSPTQSQTTYYFPTDVTFKAHIDNHSKVSFDDPARNAHYGGRIVDPAGIKENFVFTFSFDNSNQLTTTMSSPDTELGISGFYPTTVLQGDLVYVLGSGFTADTRVNVGGTLALLSHTISDNVLVFIAPFGSNSGAITLRNPDTSTITAQSIRSASPLFVKSFQGINKVALENYNNIIANTAVTDAIKTGNVLALADIGLPVKTFAGLRDDPFIRTTATGKNIAAMALEMPQSLFTHGRQKVLISWAASGYDAISGHFSDVAGGSFISMFEPEKNLINTLHPSQHVAALEAAAQLSPPVLLPCQTPYQNGIVVAPFNTDCSESERMLKSPDVAIFDTTKPQSYPNGRALTDDVVDLIAPYDPRVNGLLYNPTNGENVNGSTSPTVNDVPLSDTFPYFGLPQP